MIFRKNKVLRSTKLMHLCSKKIMLMLSRSEAGAGQIELDKNLTGMQQIHPRIGAVASIGLRNRRVPGRSRGLAAAA